MKRLLLCILLAPLLGGHSHPQMRWLAARPVQGMALAGYPQLQGVEHAEVYRGTEGASYSHHPAITWHDGTFYAMWSNHCLGEDGPGQRVLAARSLDGMEWGRAFELFAPHDACRDPEEHGLAVTPLTFVRVGPLLYAVAEVTLQVGFDEDGRRSRQSIMKVARAVDGQGTGRYVDLDDLWYREARLVRRELGKPENTPPWDFAAPPLRAVDGHLMAEPATYRAARGWVRLLRDQDMSRRLYVQHSRAGVEWSAPVRTDLPDAPGKMAAGVLPDGRRYLLGNLVPGWDHEPHRRDALVVALSPDGYRFTRAAVVRAGAPALRQPGFNKGPGYQYPSAVVVGGDLHVIYSVGKEDIHASRVALSEL